MKILLIHGDDAPWATHNRALELKKRWTEDEVDILRYDKTFDGDQYDIIHILFSGGLHHCAGIIDAYPKKTLTTLSSYRTLEGVYDPISELKRLYSKSKAIVAQNLDLKEKLIGIIGEENQAKVHYIPNGVDEKIFNHKFTVSYVGNDQAKNAEYKGFHLVEQACRELDLQCIATRNNYPHHIIPNNKMPEFYKNIDCLVIPSAGEGCNNPMLEALAMNIPVISTKTGIAEELEGVILVDRTVEDIKRALRKVCPRIGILEKYTWDIIAKQYHDLYVEQ